MIEHTEVMKQALEALEDVQYYGWGQTERDYDARTAAITAIREALTSVPDWASEAKEQPAPVAKPRKQEPLTDEQYFEIGQRHWLPSIKVEKIHKEIIEAAHGITKGGAA